MEIKIFDTARQAGVAAGQLAASMVRSAIEARSEANIILATGMSQFETLNQLVSAKGIDWSKVSMFHLDEYIDLPITHPASFRRYLQERFLQKLPALKAAHLINGEEQPAAECQQLNRSIAAHSIDVALVGIGENGHLAFNDPPADFETDEPYIVVELDAACRMQQVNEGWFGTIDEVPRKAISMSIQQILKSRQIICTVPDARKATAVKNAVEGTVDNLCPASALQRHPHCTLYLDLSSSALLTAGGITKTSSFQAN